MTTPRGRAHLTLVHSSDHGNDLPPMWDGMPISWSPWTVAPGSFSFHIPVADLACQECGLIEEPLRASGRVNDGGPKWIWLTVSRCAGCLHDTVYDSTTHQSWDLDASDYNDTGSNS